MSTQNRPDDTETGRTPRGLVAAVISMAVHLGLLLLVLSLGSLDHTQSQRIRVEFHPKDAQHSIPETIREAPRPHLPPPLPRLLDDPHPSLTQPPMPTPEIPQLPAEARPRLRQGFAKLQQPAAQRGRKGGLLVETSGDGATTGGASGDGATTGEGTSGDGAPGLSGSPEPSGDASTQATGPGLPAGDPFAGSGTLGARRRDDPGQPQRWRQQVGKNLRRFKRYPDSALELNIEGKVLLDFTVDCQGSLLEVHNLSPEADESLVDAAKDALAAAVQKSPDLQDPVLELSLAAACPLPAAASARDCRRAPAGVPMALLDATAQLAFEDCLQQPQGPKPEWCLRRYRLTVGFQFKDGQFQPREDSVPPAWRPALRASARELALPCTALRLRLPVLFRIED